MYHPIQLLSFSLMHLEYFLEDLSDDDARVRIAKADGSRMNAISWIVCHVAGQWLGGALRTASALDDGLQELLDRRSSLIESFESPPSLQEARRFLHDVRERCRWVETSDDGLLDSLGPEDRRNAFHPSETIGTSMLRAVFHNWCHMGEINAVRQMLGHPEIEFVRFMGKNAEWLPADSAAPEWVPYPPIHQVAPNAAAYGQRAAHHAELKTQGADAAR